MKYENIKAGDTVYIQKGVIYDWGSSMCFWIPVKVDKVTKTQFVIGDRKFKKDNGSEIGKYSSYARLLGDVYNMNEKVVDQTSEMEDFIQRVNLSMKINKMISKLKGVSPNDELTNLLSIQSMLNKIIELSK